MKAGETLYYFKKLRQKYLMLRVSEIVIWSFSAAVFTHGVAWLMEAQPFLRYGLSSATTILVFIIGFVRFRLHRLNESRFVSFINERYPQLEESADLLIKEGATLNPLELLQRHRTIEKFRQVYPVIRFPHRLGQAVLTFAISAFVSLALVSFSGRTQMKGGEKKPIRQHKAVGGKSTRLPVAIKSIVITVTPPAYTAIRSYQTENPDLTLPEGSQVQWKVQFTDSIRQAHFVFSGKDTMKLKRQKDHCAQEKAIDQSGFYQILWRNNNGESKSSDFYKIEAVPDRTPDATVNNLKQSTELTIHDKLILDLNTTLTDDYSLRDAYIIATVSKGSGESVKFREEKLRFTAPQKISGKRVNAKSILDLLKLGLEPGDELYFYVEALDNRQPVAQRSRTETYFITLQDTATDHLSVDAGLGVDLMPEYFRSQRQIIIDTEKLLRQRKQLTKQTFNFTSNELGYDQKVLRLKYGEFLGEEFESEVAETEDPVTEAPPEEQTEEDASVEEKFGHAHDKDNEHNLVEEKKPTTTQKNKEEAADPEKEKDPLIAFKHEHDKLEEATFFTQSIRAKLKAALTVMWDAELHLRLFDPERSLPYQYKALKLLKEIANDSRIYVHKTGFDPPPIKEDKRLTGDLAEIRNTLHESQRGEFNHFPGITRAVAVTENILRSPDMNLSEADKEVLLMAAKELSALAVEYPGKFLTALSLIKSLNEGEIKEDQFRNTLITVRKAFWQALPEKIISPGQQPQADHRLDQLFIKKLDALKNE